MKMKYVDILEEHKDKIVKMFNDKQSYSIIADELSFLGCAVDTAEICKYVKYLGLNRESKDIRHKDRRISRDGIVGGNLGKTAGGPFKAHVFNIF